MASRQGDQPSGSKRSTGRNIGQFVIDKEIGKGSFAQVYMGWHKDSGAAVAIKSVELARLNKKLKENLYGEIQILKALRHPHIVALHDCVESSTHINLIMEYCELGDLSLLIKKRDKLTTHPATHDMALKYPVSPNSGLHEVVIRHFLKQLASALEFLRRSNYVHRDVKPQNLLLLPSQSFRQQRALHIMSASQDSLIPIAGLASLPMLKLADFGFARVLPSTSLADTLCGSPLYMAPEILRYERYDAKADLWSVGTVLYEMVTGRPPFRARNHVELLRKIEAADDAIKFPREALASPELKALIRLLLRRSPVERLSFDAFFRHAVVVDDIPALADDDVPRRRELETIPQGEALGAAPPSPQTASPAPDARSRRPNPADARRPSNDAQRPSNDAQRPSNDAQRPSNDAQRPSNAAAHAAAHAVTHAAAATHPPCDALGLHRTPSQHAASAPSHAPQPTPRPLRDAVPPDARPRRHASPARPLPTDEEQAAQDVMFERDYVVVERRHVEVNALADELAANQGPPGPRGGAQTLRRHTHQGAPTSASSAAMAVPALQTALVAHGRAAAGQDRRSSYEKALASSPNSASSAITKAIQDASLRLFGFKVAPVRGAKGPSPPMYQPFPAYPTPTAAPAGLLGDGRTGQSPDEDVRAKDAMEEYAERSDCVYGFAEVKYKQLVPLAPSVEHGLGGVAADQQLAGDDDGGAGDEGLTAEAIVSLSEEALVLYVKSLTLLARAMDIASVWWSKKSRAAAAAAAGSGVSAAVSEHVAQKINAIVQWVRQRFNEVLEKSEVVRLKLTEAQKLLPEDHASHPANHGGGSLASSSSSSSPPPPPPAAKQVYLTPGISAEKLMYDRALDMSRAAAIDEVTNENLAGCKISYMTAIRMLEAVLEGDDEAAGRRAAGGREAGGKEPARGPLDGGGELDSDEEAHVRKMIKMISARLASVTKKQQMIAEAKSKEQQAQARAARRRSGELTPRSVPSHAST